MARRTLLASLIARKERALQQYVEILQRPLRRRDSTADIADWLLYFAGSDTAAQSADPNSYAKLTLPVAMIWGERDSITPLEQAHDLQPAAGDAEHIAGRRSYPANRASGRFNDALLAVLKKL